MSFFKYQKVLFVNSDKNLNFGYIEAAKVIMKRMIIAISKIRINDFHHDNDNDNDDKRINDNVSRP